MERACELVELLDAGDVMDGVIIDKHFDENAKSLDIYFYFLIYLAHIKIFFPSFFSFYFGQYFYLFGN